MACGEAKSSRGVFGVVLAGGLARRMGGGDKPLLRLHGRPLLDHVAERLRPQVQAMALNANGDPARFAAYGLPVLPDPMPGHPGPLAGVLAGMLWARGIGPAAAMVLSVPGDTPFLPHDLVAKLLAGGGGGLAYASSAGRAHPTVALWPAELADALATAVGQGQRRVRAWADCQRAAVVDFTDGGRDPFLNVNTPDDLAAAERLLVRDL